MRPVPEGRISGTISGQEWTFVQGDISAFLSEGDTFFTSLYATTYDACGFGPGPEDAHLIIRVPKEVGAYPFTMDQNMTFVTFDEEGPVNEVVLEGQVTVEEVTDSKVTASLVARLDANNDVGGSFTVEFCEGEAAGPGF